MLSTTRSTLAPFAAVALLLGVGGCGSGGSGSTPAGASTPSAAATTPTATATTAAGASTQAASPAAKGTSTGTHPPAPTTTAPSTTTPHRLGGVAGGENPKTYGSNAAASERAAVTTTVKAYYAAIAADRGAAACALLDAPLQHTITLSIGRIRSLKGKGCAGIITLLFHHRRGPLGSLSSAVTVTGVRVNGDHGYALISTKTKPSGEIRIARENGAWKIGSLIGSSLR